MQHVWETNDVCIAPRLANPSLKKLSRGGGWLLSSITAQRLLWVGSNQPRKRVDLVAMRKKLETRV